jgi:hypothetical protein
MTLPADYEPYVEELEKYISELRNSDGMDIEFDPHSAPLAVSDAAAIAFKLQQVGGTTNRILFLQVHFSAYSFANGHYTLTPAAKTKIAEAAKAFCLGSGTRCNVA